MISVASPTGQQWRIGYGRQEVIVCEVGATLRTYSVREHPVVDGFGVDEWSHSGRGQILAPWPNRLADGRYEFNGVRAQAALGPCRPGTRTSSHCVSSSTPRPGTRSRSSSMSNTTSGATA